MKTIKIVLGGLLWPVAFLFLKKMPLLHRAYFFVAGIANVFLTVLFYWLARNLDQSYPASRLAIVTFIFLTMALIIVYSAGYFAYLRRRMKMLREDIDKGIKPMSRFKIWWYAVKANFLRFWRKAGLWFSDRKSINQDSKMTEIIKTLKVMDEHAKRARVLWARSQGGGGFSHFL
ncbi:hypothetical protein KJ665_02675 [Patescibacteria group bacterium]|nr:hypothetical protein [Patescibacteria group bacterium]